MVLYVYNEILSQTVEKNEWQLPTTTLMNLQILYWAKEVRYKSVYFILFQFLYSSEEGTLI